MIVFMVLSGIIGIFGLLMSVFPDVIALPYGIDEAMSFFVNTVKSIIIVFPFMQVIWNLILLSLTIEVLLFTWTWVRWFIERIR